MKRDQCFIIAFEGRRIDFRQFGATEKTVISIKIFGKVTEQNRTEQFIQLDI